jgi:hypothetical protein
MWRDRDRYPEHNYVPDTFWLVAAALLFAACGLVWLIGQVAAILFGAHQHLPVRLVDMLGVLLRLPGTWDDPSKAWPPSSQPLLPGPVGCTPPPSSPSGCPPSYMDSWSGCCRPGPVGAASNVGPDGQACGSSVVSSSSAPGGGGSSWAGATA